MAEPMPVRSIDSEIIRVILDLPGATTTDIQFAGLDVSLPEMVRSLQRLEDGGHILRQGKGYVVR